MRLAFLPVTAAAVAAAAATAAAAAAVHSNVAFVFVCEGHLLKIR
jgi:hypothetical protein